MNAATGIPFDADLGEDPEGGIVNLNRLILPNLKRSLKRTGRLFLHNIDHPVDPVPTHNRQG